jgi:predicted metal-dependent peptidase
MSQKQDQDQDQGGGGKGSGQDQAAQGSPSPSPGGPDQDKGKGSGQGSGQPQGRKPGQGWGDVLDGTDDQGAKLSHSDLDQAENEWKIAMNQAAQVAKAQGNLPADLARMVQELINPRIPWVEQLRSYLELIARNDYNFAFPSRRYICGGIYIPSLRSQELPEIVMVLDTSDSITQKEFDIAAAEVTGLLDAYDTTVHVVYCSNRVTETQTFTRADYPLQFTGKGRGGTDFRPAFQWVDDQGITPAVLIYLTDLECSRYPLDPGYPVIWARVDHGRKVGNPPFGEIIEIAQF